MAGNPRAPGGSGMPLRDRLTGVLVPAGPLQLSAEEVRQLWSFIHGDIMQGSIRRLLRASLGLCPRHTWAYAAVEIELWQAGAGSRGGHQPFDVSILYEDLLAHVADGLDRRRSLLHRHPDNVLTPVGPCRICLDTSSGELSGLRMGYANSNTEDLTAEANALIHTTTWCFETVGIWRDRVCPECDPAIPQGAGDPALLCRYHLAHHRPVHQLLRTQVAARLGEVRSRLRHLTISMTDQGRQAGAEENTSWVETLGFFAGWGLPLYLATDPREAWAVPASQHTEHGD